MSLISLRNTVCNKDNFSSIDDYLEFSLEAIEYIEENNQAEIVSQNENAYRFYQFNGEGDFQITRPFNSNLLYSREEFENIPSTLLDELQLIKDNEGDFENSNSDVINRGIYTTQQSIGFILDAITEKNKARKLNGDLFEQFILKVFNEVGVECKSGTIRVPVMLNGKEFSKMNYQHDIIVADAEEVKLIGSVKTTSKDRIDKIFIDKFLFSKLTETSIPHIAIFLHDVQRADNKKDPTKYNISSTFLPGRFKGYTIKLNPLDGVYYFDLRPNMLKDEFLKDHIHKFDKLLYSDIWKFV